MPFQKHVMRPPGFGPKKQGSKKGGEKVVETGGRDRAQCEVCKCLSSQALSEVEAAWLAGHPLEKLARDLQLDPVALEKHERVCLVNRHRSRYARVASAFDNLYAALDVAHRQYMKVPSRGNALSYQALIGELRVIMTDLDRVQNADELADDLVAYALNPLIQALTQTIISETGAMKEDLLAKFGEDEADDMVSSFIRRLTTHFKAATERSRDRVLDVLTARDKNRGQALRGGKKPAGKHGHLKAVS